MITRSIIDGGRVFRRGCALGERISSFPVKPRAKAVSALVEPPPPLEFEEDAADDIDLQTALEQIMEGLWPYSAGDHRFMTSS